MHYVVQPGDTLGTIAYQHGTIVQAILAANGLSNPNMIYAGQHLMIPVHTHGYVPGMPAHEPYPSNRLERLEHRVESLERRIARLEQGHM